jgi:outer membrane receptor protein involved in Fe transport
MRQLYGFLLLGMLSAFSLHAQDRDQGRVLLVITVQNSHHQPLPYATVKLSGGKSGGLTDSTGTARIYVPEAGRYAIEISSLGYKAFTENITATGTRWQKRYVLEDNPSQLQAVQVNASSHGAQLKLNPVKAQVINTAASQEQPSTLIELMNRSAGIRVRQAGSLGSSNDVILNGFQNRAIRYFKDGMPLNYLGAGFNISLVRVDMLDHIEVYKGVLPAYLGADALGGAINLVTKHRQESFAELSYEVGSFNTHRVSLNAEYRSPNSHYFAGIHGFFNYSDGNYQVDVHPPHPQTGVPQDVHAELFHNRFSNYYAEAYAGISQVSWADELRISLIGFSLRTQFQFGSTMFKPMGAAHGTQYSVVPTLQYKKSFLNNALQLTEFAEINTLHATITDTVHGHYDWLGQFYPNGAEKGEISNRGSLSISGTVSLPPAPI